jgi:hypothetical protein
VILQRLPEVPDAETITGPSGPVAAFDKDRGVAVGVHEDPEPFLDQELLTRDLVTRGIKRAIFQGHMTPYEDGFPSELATAVERYLSRFGVSAVKALMEMFLREQLRPADLSEVLRTLGRVSDLDTVANRFWLLVLALKHKESTVRFGATIGLEALEDRRAREYLLPARESEDIPLLQRRMTIALDALAGP